MRHRTRLAAIIHGELGRERRSLAVAVAATLSFAGAQLLAPWPLKVVFDQILLDKPAPDSLSFLRPVLDRGAVVALVVLSVAMVAIALARGLFAYLQIYVTSRVGFQVMRSVQRELFAHLQRLPLAFHTRSRSGELLTRMTADTATLRDTFGSYVVPSIGDALTLVGMFVVMVLLDWRLALVPLLSFPVLYVTLRRLYGRTKAAAREQRKSEGRIAARVSEVLTAVSLVQAYGRESFEQERLADETEQSMRESVRTARLEAANSRSVEAVTAVATAACVLVGALRVRQGAITPGDLLVFSGYLSQMYKPLRALAKVSTKVSKAAVSAERINELLALEPAITDAPHATPAARLTGAVALDDVRFAYEGNEVLHGVTLRIEPGRRVALVGASGAGKSTIASLLLRFYDPTSGTVTVDGHDVRDLTLESLRSQIAVVPQESALFACSIADNIGYGRPGATTEEIEAAARAANAHDFIMALEDGYETVLGERGATLSGGQRRRLAIARALVRDAPILVLDEPMTGLDAASEASVRDAIARLMAGRTCLTITHDLHATAEADTVVVLDGGRVVDQGSHAELYGRNLTYRRLVELRGAAPRRTAPAPSAVHGV